MLSLFSSVYSPMDRTVSKDRRRREARARLRTWLQVSQSHRELLQIKLLERLRPLLQTRSGIWGSYRALKSEPDVFQDMEQLATQTPGLRLAYPQVGSDSQLHFSIPVEPLHPESFHSTPLKILEPAPARSEAVMFSRLRGVLVPGIAFDESGVRLGRGKGYYDRRLSDFCGLKIGLAWEAQIWRAGSLPCADWDIKMDLIVTESRTLRFGRPSSGVSSLKGYDSK